MPTEPGRPLSRKQLSLLEGHVTGMWPQLTRSLKDAIGAVHDEKLGDAGREKWPLYVSASENPRRVRERLRKTLAPESLRRIDIRVLSGAPEQINDHGLVYLPGRYVVPGGRFNEMYGWDSYFIAMGLLAEGRVSLAQSMADQHLYQVRHYGTVLNCNRTYCLTRSQPPFLARMVLAIFQETGDAAWLREVLPDIERYYGYWASMPQFLPGLGLSRYHALGDGPAPEALHGERDASGRNHYERLRDWLRTHGTDAALAVQCYDGATDSLTLAAYKDDRTVRESGFDLTGRFGICGMGIRDFAPVCLNTLLWKMEKDLSAIRSALGASPQSVEYWEKMAASRVLAMNRCFWDEKSGLFLDWQLSRSRRRDYPFLTTFWPMWAGWASPAQAARVVENLPLFETSYGLLTSTSVTGCQWDAPFMWAPMVLMAVQGLQSYGYERDAARIAGKFLGTLAADFERTGSLFEKYDATTGSSDMEGKITFGYPTNEPGFGWTNASVRLLAACHAVKAA